MVLFLLSMRRALQWRRAVEMRGPNGVDTFVSRFREGAKSGSWSGVGGYQHNEE